MAIGYQLKITIRGSKPPIWRRIIVPEHIAFCDLDDIIEKIFGWTHSHLYEFFIKDWGMRITGAPVMEEEDNAEECIDSWMKVGGEIVYTYDFGDNWEHMIKIEKIVEYDYRYPTVLKSKGSNMIEDCGGIWGFYDCEEDAEAFDMKAVNEEFRSWVIPIAEPLEELMGLFDEDDDDEYDDLELDGFTDDIENDFFAFLDNEDDDEFAPEWDDEFNDILNGVAEEEQYVRHTYGEVESLEDVYLQFLKENLVEIAKVHRLSGYSKYNKQRLAEWLVKQLLEEQHMLNHILNATKDELELFDKAIEEKGIFISEGLIEESLFLSTYGGFLPYYNFYHIPLDVQEQYQKLMTDSVREYVAQGQLFEEICQACIFLYGVISVEDLQFICQKYGLTDFSETELHEKMIDLATSDALLRFCNGYLIDARLQEENVYMEVRKEQEKIDRYLPEDSEEFLAFGRNEMQEIDENTVFFLEYIMKEANLDYPHASLAFYLIQEAIRMNQDDEELFEILSDLGCPFHRRKQFEKAAQMLKKITNRTRKWEYNGHTWMELNQGIVEFTVERKRNPNALCPCGSGKKYKYCCGKGK